ncbi:uncharacterized protein [Procambarus clarkii]|uniref:uncharacterized protein n=1 Tax=Procambarus clarkii TaxID=6728 RepID=UPI001E673958|nr:uncharacterized protein LOC123756815 [Procambarus clarkii]
MEGWHCLGTVIVAFCYLLNLGKAGVCAGSGEEPRVLLQLELGEPYVYEQGQRCGTDTGCLFSFHTDETSGEDNLGEYVELRKYYNTSQGAIVVHSSRSYITGVLVFKQEFPDGLQGTSTGNKDLVSACYPSLVLPSSSDAPDLRYITPGGFMAGWTLYSHGSMFTDVDWFRDGEDGGVVVLFQGEDEAVASVVVSALTQPMATNVWLDRDHWTLDWGVQGLAEHIPAGFSSEVIIYPGVEGITKNIMAWGDALKRYHGAAKMQDTSADFLTYYTDNGAYHYYNPLPYINFRDALTHVYNYSLDNNIPFRRLQLDSWWYYKGVGFGVKNWTEIPLLLPGGIAGLHQTTGWPIVAHNRYFSSDTVYAQQNGGQYPFTVDEETGKSLPLDKSFWDDLLDEALTWGLATYEQDWLDRQYMFTSALHTNVTLGSSWLDNMGKAAEERGLNIQYCMSLTRHVLHSVSLPAVTQIRVSGDYLYTPGQWRIGASSLLPYALGLRPFKDVFWSSQENVDAIYNDCEVVTNDDPLTNIYNYNGNINITASGKPCVPWKDFGWDDLYYTSTLFENLCRNPDNIKEGAFCFTKASFDVPEEEWEWEYCDVPKCELDCYTFNGILYQGDQNVTQSGQVCVDWAGEHNIHGAVCRNPNNDAAPWCYVTEDHLEKDFCNNKCLEAVELNSYLQGAVSTLSGGPVGVGDKAQNLNVQLIMKSCNAEGRLLQPTKPLTVVDGYFFSSDYREVWTGYSTIGNYNFGIIFLAEVDKALQMTPSELNLENAFTTKTFLFSNYPENSTYTHDVSSGQTIDLPACGGFLNFCLIYTSPAFQINTGEIFILGEREKWAPVSPERLSEITESPSSLTVVVSGVQGEAVTISFLDQTIFTVTCNFTETGTMIIDTTERTCQ